MKSTSSYDVQLNEYIIWSHDDSHSKAYSVLMTERSRAIAAKLGLPNAVDAKICLDCHTDNVPAEVRGKEFNIADGVGCEACHGGAEKWIESHTMKTTSYTDNLKNGMYPTATLPNRAPLCLVVPRRQRGQVHHSSHHGRGPSTPELRARYVPGAAAFASRHRQGLCGAQAGVQPHGRVGVRADRGRAHAGAADPAVLRQRSDAVFPELALFSCHSCHQSSMHQLDWARGLTTIATQPGSVPLNDGHLRMAILIARQVSPAIARDIVRALAVAAGGELHRVASECCKLSGRLESALRDLQNQAADRKWTTGEQTAVLTAILDLGSRGNTGITSAPEQAVMATELLMLDLGTAARNRARLDALFKLVSDDEAYRPDQFVTAVDQLRAALGMSGTMR